MKKNYQISSKYSKWKKSVLLLKKYKKAKKYRQSPKNLNDDIRISREKKISSGDETILIWSHKFYHFFSSLNTAIDIFLHFSPFPWTEKRRLRFITRKILWRFSFWKYKSQRQTAGNLCGRIWLRSASLDFFGRLMFYGNVFHVRSC